MATYQVTGIQKINDTLAHFLAWTQVFGQALSSLGWVKQSGHGELVDNGLSGASFAWANTGSVLTLPTTGLLPVMNYRFNGAWVSGNTYTGGNTIGNTTTTDLVTYTAGGTTITYVHITATSSLTTAPPSDTTNWQPYMYEIWKSNGSNTASLPLYLRIVYTTSAATNGQPAIHFGVGTGVDANGNLTNPIQLSGNNPTYNAIIYSSATGTANTSEMDFSGDADNLRFVCWRGDITNTSTSQWLMVLDRAKTATGADSDAFVYFGGNYPAQASTRMQNAIIPNSSLGASPIMQFGTTSSIQQWLGAICSPATGVTLNAFGNTPVMPIFPLVGYLANPLLGIVGFNKTDVNDGGVYPAWLYGSSHNYLVSSANAANGQCTLNGLGNSVAPAIRWE